jgi:Protein of unknown function (DUF2914)
MRRYLPIPKDLEQLIHWHERYTSPLSLIAGFLLDTYILLRRVDLWESNALLIFYLLVAGGGIVLLNAVEAGRIRHPRVLSAAPLLPVLVQFAFGGLFSGFVSLYSRSAAFFGTWIFIAVLAGLMVGNERFRKLYLRYSFQIAVYFGALFCFFIFFLPIVFGWIGDTMFIWSGFAAIAGVAVLLYILSLVAPELERKERTASARSVAVIWLVVNVLYFSNLIPPLPLALKDAGVYHSVVRQPNGTYTMQGEPAEWYESIVPTGTTFHRTLGNAVYVFSAIFAPTGLSTTIIHEWQHYDEAKRAWVTESTFSFAINGGRDGGYRGYTLKSAPALGAWRVNVLTSARLYIGRVTFTVTDEPARQKLVSSTH